MEEEVRSIGMDLAKRSFQVRGATADGSVAYRKKVSRGKLLSFLASQPGCKVAMEACASARYWGREVAALGHEVKLVAPIYVKPFVKRGKNDAADAQAITGAAQRPTRHLVAVKTKAQQGQGMLFHSRDLLVRRPSPSARCGGGCGRRCPHQSHPAPGRSLPPPRRPPMTRTQSRTPRIRLCHSATVSCPLLDGRRSG